MINKMLMFFVNLMQKYLPHPFTIAWLITLVVCVMALTITRTGPLDIITYWGNGFFQILAFAMQMTLVLVSGYALASATVVRRFLRNIAKIPKTPKQTIFFVALVSMALYYCNWGLGLIAGGFLAREVAKVHSDTDFRLIVTAAFSGIIITHGGLSASVPLVINTQGHTFQAQMGLIPLTQTIFHAQALFITGALVVFVPLLCVLMHPSKDKVIAADPKLFEDEVELFSQQEEKATVIADKLDRSKILNLLLGIMGTIFLAGYFIKNGFNLNVNILIFIFIILGVFAHGTLVKYSQAFTSGTATAAGIILQFPLYAGIMGIMDGSGLVHVISGWLLSLSNYETFEIFTYLSSLIISIFVPSAGGHWVVQAPFMLPAAAELGVEPWKVAMGVAWGESIWNVVCPFWALPLLAIAKISIRDLIGFAVLLFLLGNVIAISGILLFPH